MGGRGPLSRLLCTLGCRPVVGCGAVELADEGTVVEEDAYTIEVGTVLPSILV